MESILLYDTTLRDGTQGEKITFTVKDKLRIARKLDDLGIHYIEGGWPGSNDKDREFFESAKILIDDMDDVPFIALCLASKADGVWSDDIHFKTRKEITIYRTRELAIAFKPRKK